MKLLIGFLLLSLAACSDETAIDEEDKIKFLSNDAYREAGFPFSEAVEVDGWLILSGVIGTKPGTTELVEGGIEAESHAVMTNIQTTLKRHGASMERVVKCTVMIDDMVEWPAFNTVYKSYFKDNYPARSAFGADGLALGAKVEVECWARR